MEKAVLDAKLRIDLCIKNEIYQGFFQNPMEDHHLVHDSFGGLGHHFPMGTGTAHAFNADPLHRAKNGWQGNALKTRLGTT